MTTYVLDSGGWGNNVVWLRTGESVSGHLTPLPVVGDFVESPMRSKRTGRFRIVKVVPLFNPPDMFFADVEFDGYVS